MKLNSPKTGKKKFDPARHWMMLLGVIVALFILIIGYAVYSLFYIKGQIVLIEAESLNNVFNSTSTDQVEKTKSNRKFMRDINNLNAVIDEFDKKDINYRNLIQSMQKNPVNIATTSASTTVATSTN